MDARFLSVLTLWALLLCSQAFASTVPVIDLSQHPNGSSTGEHYQYLQDPSEQQQLQDVIQHGQWLAPAPGVVNHGLSPHPSWMRFQLYNPGSETLRVVLSYLDASVERIDLYYREQGSEAAFDHEYFVISAPVEQRPVAYYRPAFPVSLQAGQTLDVYVRIFQGNEFPMHSFTAMRIWQDKPFMRASHIELALLMVLLCSQLGMAIVTLIAYAATREGLFLCYAGFALTGLSMFAAASGLWNYFLVREGYQLWMVVLQISLCQIAALIFIRQFLQVPEYLPRLDKALIAIIGIQLLGVVLNLSGHPHFSRTIIDYTAVAYVLVLPMAYYAHRRGVSYALLFIASWAVFIIGMGLASLRYRGHVPDSAWTEWMIYIGGFIEVFLLSTIMVLRVREMLHDRQQAEAQHRKHLLNTADELSLQLQEANRQLEAARDKAEHEARTDMLTSLPNRRAFFEQAGRWLARAGNHKLSSLHLLLADIDHFKRINDSNGHLIGDKVLAAVAAELASQLGERGWVARLGGEEFVILLENHEQADALACAEQLRAAIASRAVVMEDTKLSVTLSIGISRWSEETSLSSLLKQADQALGQAKAAGRNRVACLPEAD